MFCPKCRAEYLPEVQECPDCHEPLVEALPPEPVWDYVDLVTVYSVFDQGQLAMVKSILEAAGIRHFAQGEAFTSIGYPMFTGIRIQVAREDAEDARNLLAGLDEADAGEEDPSSPES
jgi:hypothetical protein